jgi:hypothetical protein
MDNIELVTQVFSILEDTCEAIYYGGSRVDPVIDNPHDYDYICFAKRLRTQSVQRILAKNHFTASHSANNKNNVKKSRANLNDFSQIRSYPYTQITWFSYLDPLMIKIIGEDICPKTDIICKHRSQFLQCLREKANDLLTGKMLNQKRWYHILRGVYILMNNSYEVTPEQRVEINILHEGAPGHEQIRDKTIELLKALH